MKRFVFPGTLTLILALGGLVRADSIHLKNGNIIEGTVVKNDGKKIWLKIGNRATLVYDLADVEKIEKDEKDGEDYFKRKGGIGGRDGYNPFGRKGEGTAGGEADGENPWVDETEPDEETKAKVDLLVRDLRERQDNRYLIRAKNKLIEIGYPAGKQVLELLDSPKEKVRQRAVEILEAIDYKPAAPHIINKILSDESGFARDGGIKALAKFTGKTFGYAPYDPLPTRERAVARWEAWWTEEEAKHLESEDAEVPESMKKKDEDGGDGGDGEEEAGGDGPPPKPDRG